MSEPTAIFSIRDERDQEIRAIMQEVYDALKEKGYNPINQIVGYILSEDPTYITNKIQILFSKILFFIFLLGFIKRLQRYDKAFYKTI